MYTVIRPSGLPELAHDIDEALGILSKEMYIPRPDQVRQDLLEKGMAWVFYGFTEGMIRKNEE